MVHVGWVIVVIGIFTANIEFVGFGFIGFGQRSSISLSLLLSLDLATYVGFELRRAELN
jgi:hypothetical protein|tara:strand:- start:323 stop:499 length:177 start_codon:yes stop_codon:yes gene_type:complete